MKIVKKIYKKVLFVGLLIYAVFVFISQQNTLNTYNKEVSKYKKDIEEAKETKESLIAMKDNINSPEYIEEIAREKLGMYLPNERVFIDIGK
ncbi:MAG: septum formation initiator family protein [Clostridia bacterium]|nr:septum formation initiator family protein [Clostridia bacterium]